MSIVHQQDTFYNAIPYNPLVWSTHVLVTTLTTNTLDTSTNTNLYDGSTSTFCETNAIAVTNEKKLIKWDRQQVTPNCPSMKRPLRMWVRNFTAGSLEFYVDGVNLVVNTNSAAETATGGWVDVATGSGTVSTWEVRATTDGANVSIAAVEGGKILHCDTFDRIEFGDIISTTEDYYNVQGTSLLPNTNTAFFDPDEWESIERVVGPSGTPTQHTIASLEASERGWIHGRRPARGLQYPRGNYNK